MLWHCVIIVVRSVAYVSMITPCQSKASLARFSYISTHVQYIRLTPFAFVLNIRIMIT